MKPLVLCIDNDLTDSYDKKDNISSGRSTVKCIASVSVHTLYIPEEHLAADVVFL